MQITQCKKCEQLPQRQQQNRFDLFGIPDIALSKIRIAAKDERRKKAPKSEI